jgi:hypothetical protein
MKFLFKGCINNLTQLPISNIPNNSVKFKEPNSVWAANVVMILYFIPVLLALKGFTSLVLNINSGLHIRISMLGFIIALLITIPHEFLHAICFPKYASVYCYFMPKSLMVVVTCTEPITKLNYIWMNLCPNLLLGWIPLFVWSFIPGINIISNVLFTYAIISICMGCGDYMNIVNASIQMPRKSYQQLSGFNSYWFIKGGIYEEEL